MSKWTIVQVSNYLGIRYGEIMRLCELGMLPYILQTGPRGGRQYFFDSEMIQEWNGRSPSKNKLRSKKGWNKD
jgi:hypothetical protein